MKGIGMKEDITKEDSNLYTTTEMKGIYVEETLRTIQQNLWVKYRKRFDIEVTNVPEIIIRERGGILWEVFEIQDNIFKNMYKSGSSVVEDEMIERIIKSLNLSFGQQIKDYKRLEQGRNSNLYKYWLEGVCAMKRMEGIW